MQFPVVQLIRLQPHLMFWTWDLNRLSFYWRTRLSLEPLLHSSPLNVNNYVLYPRVGQL